MSSSISMILRKQIERLVEDQPLEKGEFRRMEGMGSHFLALHPEHEGHQHLFSFDIEGKTYYMYKLQE